MEAAIENIVSFVTINNLIVNQLNEVQGNYSCHSQGCVYR